MLSLPDSFKKINIKVINGENAGKAAYVSRTHIPKMEEVADGRENADISHRERASCQVISFYLRGRIRTRPS